MNCIWAYLCLKNAVCIFLFSGNPWNQLFHVGMSIVHYLHFPCPDIPMKTCTFSLSGYRYKDMYIFLIRLFLWRHVHVPYPVIPMKTYTFFLSGYPWRHVHFPYPVIPMKTCTCSWSSYPYEDMYTFSSSGYPYKDMYIFLIRLSLWRHVHITYQVIPIFFLFASLCFSFPSINFISLGIKFVFFNFNSVYLRLSCFLILRSGNLNRDISWHGRYLNHLRTAAFLTVSLIGWLHDICILVTNQNQFSK